MRATHREPDYDAHRNRGLIGILGFKLAEHRTAAVNPIVLQAYFGGGFHHPNLRGATVRDWPLNVFSDEDAASQLSILRAIASSDLGNAGLGTNLLAYEPGSRGRGSTADCEPESLHRVFASQVDGDSIVALK